MIEPTEFNGQDRGRLVAMILETRRERDIAQQDADKSKTWLVDETANAKWRHELWHAERARADGAERERDDTRRQITEVHFPRITELEKQLGTYPRPGEERENLKARIAELECELNAAQHGNDVLDEQCDDAGASSERYRELWREELARAERAEQAIDVWQRETGSAQARADESDARAERLEKALRRSARAAYNAVANIRRTVLGDSPTGQEE